MLVGRPGARLLKALPGRNTFAETENTHNMLAVQILGLRARSLRVGVVSVGGGGR